MHIYSAYNPFKAANMQCIPVPFLLCLEDFTQKSFSSSFKLLPKLCIAHLFPRRNKMEDKSLHFSSCTLWQPAVFASLG